MNYDSIPLVNNEVGHSFEMLIEGKHAFIDYQLRGDHILLIHTEVPHELEGHGIAAALVDKTLHYIDAHHLKLIPLCSYVKNYVERHPEWERLLP